MIRRPGNGPALFLGAVLVAALVVLLTAAIGGI